MKRGMLLYLLVIIVVFGRALWPPAGMLIFGDDIHRQYYFFREFFNHWISQGVFPWWNPYLFGGEPFIANPVVSLWYPVNWLFFLFPLNVAYSWHLGFHVFWAMTGMRRAIREIGKVGESAAWIAGLIFGLSGFFMARIYGGHVDVVAAASWMPWVVWAFYRLIVAPGDENFFGTAIRLHPAKILSPIAPKIFITAAGIFAMQLFAGYQTIAFFTVIIVAILTTLTSLRRKSLRPFILAGLAGVAGLGLAAIQIIPEAEFFRQSIRTYRLPYSWVSYGSLPFKSLIQFINPFYFGNYLAYHGPPPNFIEQTAFVGIGGLVLALIGLVMGALWRVPFTAHPSDPSAISPSHRFAKDMTGFEKARATAPLYLIFVFITFFGLWISLGSYAPIDLQYILWKIVPMYQYLRIPARHLILVVFGLAGLAGLGFDSISKSFKLPKGLTLLMIGGMTVEMVLFARGFIALQPVPETRHDKALITLLRQDKEPYRVLQNFGVWLPQRDPLDFDSVMSYGIFSATGYDPSILRRYYEVIANAAGQPGEQAMLSYDVQVPYLTSVAAGSIDALNIKYIIVPRGFDPFGGNRRYRLILENAHMDYRVYENTSVLPRFYLRDTGCGKVTTTSYTPNRIGLAVESTCDTKLVSSEVYYPGWEAFIDGEKSDITVSEGVFRTLFVSSGKHQIIYVYKPNIFYVGGALSIGTLILLAWF